MSFCELEYNLFKEFVLNTSINLKPKSNDKFELVKWITWITSLKEASVKLVNFGSLNNIHLPNKLSPNDNLNFNDFTPDFISLLDELYNKIVNPLPSRACRRYLQIEALCADNQDNEILLNEFNELISEIKSILDNF